MVSRWLLVGAGAAVLLAALLIRVHREHARMLALAGQATQPAERGLLLAEAARWSWPIGGDRRHLLKRALGIARDLRGTRPEDARAIAEEVRATLYVIRVGSPPEPDILKRANKMIVDLLAARDGLGPKAHLTLAERYAQRIGPKPLPYALSSVGFVLWLLGMWIGIRREGRRRLLGCGLSVVGLCAFLGFLAIA